MLLRSSSTTIIASYSSLLLPIVAQALSSTDTSSNMSTTSSVALRSVKQILPAAPRHWVGDGFHVHPVFSNKAFTEELSPFLMFDYAVPQRFEPNNGSPRGVGQHPHRGFETVTIAFKGEVEHADSVGNRDVIKPGDVQWMTAGRGIIHQEFHSNEFSKKGGEFEMCQLWVNLPKKNKMTKPHYQPIVNKNIPVVDLKEASLDGECSEEPVGSVRVIAGSFLGTKGPATTFSPVELWDATIQKKGTVVDFPFPDDFNCIVFVRRGEIDIMNDSGDKKRVSAQGVALMKRENGSIRIQSDQKNTSLLIMGGLPLNEPIAARGPFVMNTWDEINKANRDYMMGKFGK
mmetsp:Transcript_16841/g.27516  ORF Transcript_16841/g.27516 Transcript_16841/m.27516 type:complete len:345 (-) Transcript_16841:38-1072(-)